VVAAKTDRARSFSHQLAAEDNASMFLPTRTCWNALQAALADHSQSSEVNYILKIDVANFFGSLNLHTLINVLSDSGYPQALSSKLEAILTSYTSSRSSRGILQGIFPSDLFGNFYLEPIDRFLKEHGVRSARYVDDIYIFVDSVESTDRLLRELIPTLRSYDLVLNEAKSAIIPKAYLHSEEPDLEALFDAAVEEIAEQTDDQDFDADYGFQSDWDEDGNEDEEDLELKATMVLFDSTSKFIGQEENIERFCLPLFSKSGSDHALQHVLESFRSDPQWLRFTHMSRIFLIYTSCSKHWVCSSRTAHSQTGRRCGFWQRCHRRILIRTE
jgi:hypothetical protein